MGGPIVDNTNKLKFLLLLNNTSKSLYKKTLRRVVDRADYATEELVSNDSSCRKSFLGWDER